MVAKRHHFIPKCYLEAFCVQGDKKKASDIYVFDAVARKDFRTSPDNVALQIDFNTVDLEGHEPDAFELAIASVKATLVRHSSALWPRNRSPTKRTVYFYSIWSACFNPQSKTTRTIPTVP